MLHAKIGQLPIENDFLAGGLAEHNAMMDHTHHLSVVRRCQPVRLVRSTAYNQPTPVSNLTLAGMRWIDKLPLRYPFASAHMLRDLSRQVGYAIGR